MKCNININMFGTLYSIDEDAYELLKKYLDNLRDYFSKQEGGNEIADDLERRVAELFEELKEQGVKAISIEDVQTIIRRIGNPEEMDDGEEKAKPAEAETKKESSNAHDDATQKPLPKKKLFRDPSDSMLGGVMSGLAHYFGGEVLWWRLGIILLCLFSKLYCLPVYLILWIIMPQARTAEDFLLMKGEDVTANNLGETIINGQAGKGAKDGSSIPPSSPRVGFDRILAFCVNLLKIFIYMMIVVAFVASVSVAIAALVCICVALVGEMSWHSPFGIFMDFGGDGGLLAPFLSGASAWALWLLLISCFLSAVVLIYCFIHYYLSKQQRARPMSTLQRTSWVVVLVLFLAAIIASGIFVSDGVSKAKRNQDRQEILNERAEGMVRDEESNIDTIFNVKGKTWEIAYERIPVNKPAVYHLSVVASAKGPGAYIFMRDEGTGVTAVKEIPDDGMIYDIQIDSFPVRSRKVTYGITTKAKTTGKVWTGEWATVSRNACTVERVRDLPDAQPVTGVAEVKHRKRL